MLKWCQSIGDGDKMCLAHIQFWGPVCADPIFGALSWVCPYHVVTWFISEKWWWKVLIVPPVTKFWHKHHEDQSSPVQYLRRNCVLSFPYRQSEGFCTVSARVSSAAIKCSLRAEETCRHIKFCKRIPWYNLILYPYQSIFTVAR